MSARAVVLVALAGCGDNLAPPVPPVPQLDNARFPAESNSKLDILLLVDNSPGAVEYEIGFGAALPAFRSVLGQLDTMPSLHLGVATSDLGTTGSASASPAPSIGTAGNGGCLENGGDDGVFRRAGLHAGELFLTEESGVINADLPFVDEVAMLVKSAGGGGCGFEQHLAGVRRALTNPANGAFQRSDANLAVIILGDEDDCSVRDPALFDPSNSDLGPLASFRCTIGGLTCDQDVGTPGVKTNCHAKPGAQYVEDVAELVDFVGRQKTDRSQVIAAVIIGDPSKVEVELLPPSGGSGPDQPTLVHSCAFSDPWPQPTGLAVADPGVRDAEFALALGGPVESICHTDLAAQLADIGHAVKRLVGDPCLVGDTSGTCTVTDEYADGRIVDVPPCPASGDCYAFVAEARACPDTSDHRRVNVRRLAPPPLGTFVAVRCATGM